MNEKYELYCKVLVKTGETGIIVESYNDDEVYEIELPIFRYLSFFNRKLLSFVIFLTFALVLHQNIFHQVLCRYLHLSSSQNLLRYL